MTEESMVSNATAEPALQKQVTCAGSLAIVQWQANGVYENDLVSYQESGISMIPSPNSKPKTLKTKQNVQTSPLRVQPLRQIRLGACWDEYETWTGNLYCHVCQVCCLNAFNYKQHLEGQKHRDNLEALKFGTNSGDNANIREWCKVCRIEFVDRDMYVQHLRAQQHKEKIQEHINRRKHSMKGASEKQYWCHLCKISCQNDYNLKLHLEGKKHALQLQDVEKNEKANQEEANIKHDHHHNEGRTKSETIDHHRWCDTCKVFLTTEHNFKRHLAGKKHASQFIATDQVKRAKTEVPAAKLDKRDSDIPDKQNWCKSCNVRCSTAYNFNSHLAGRKHALQLQILDNNGGQTKPDVVEKLEMQDYVGVAGI